MVRKGIHKQADQALHDIQKTASLYLRGKTYKEIAKELGVSLQAIRKRIRQARSMWKKSAASSYQQHLCIQLAKLDEIEAAAWIGWERSLGDDLETMTEDVETTNKEAETPAVTVSRTQVKRKQLKGNATFLRTIEATVRQRSELLGLLDANVRDAANIAEEADIVSVVIADRDEAKELQTLSFAEYKEAAEAAVTANAEAS